MDVDLVSRTVRSDADRPWREIEARLGRSGLTLGWLPPISDADSIGDILSSGAHGLRASLYGTPAQNCVAVEAWVKGRRERTPLVPRSAAGADFRHLTFGTNGAHAPLTALWMRAHAKPEGAHGLIVDFLEADAAARALSQVMLRGAWPAVAIGDIDPGRVRWTLLFEGVEPIAQARYATARRLLTSAGGAEDRAESRFVVERVHWMDEAVAGWAPPKALPWGAEQAFTGPWAAIGKAAEAVLAIHPEAKLALAHPTQSGAQLLVAGLSADEAIDATSAAIFAGARPVGAHSLVDELFKATVGSMAELPREEAR